MYVQIQNSANPKQRVFFFSSDSEIEIENWCHAVKTCVEGVDVTVAAEVFKNDPIQHVDVAYKPNETVSDVFTETGGRRGVDECFVCISEMFICLFVCVCERMDMDVLLLLLLFKNYYSFNHHFCLIHLFIHSSLRKFAVN